jgi:hypothetical protein
VDLRKKSPDHITGSARGNTVGRPARRPFRHVFERKVQRMRGHRDVTQGQESAREPLVGNGSETLPASLKRFIALCVALCKDERGAEAVIRARLA